MSRLAARRLIIVLVVLFAISVAAAMIAPDRKGPLLGDSSTTTTEATTSTTTTTSTTADELPQGDALTIRIDASAAKPENAEAFVGDQVELNVGSEQARAIEIPAFGVTETAAPEAPANFNLLMREPGRLEILDADNGQLLGRLIVAEPRDRPNT